jgi:hypothetical protein
MVTVTTTVEVDLDEFDTDDLIAELNSRGHIIDTFNWWELDYLMKLIPNDIKPGSEQYTIYEKLRVLKQDAEI